MGYFCAHYDCWLWKLAFFPMRRVRIPRIPTVSDIIKGGDEGLFTMSIMDAIGPRHLSVSWRPVFEGFFREYAWTLDRLQGDERAAVKPG